MHFFCSELQMHSYSYFTTFQPQFIEQNQGTAASFKCDSPVLTCVLFTSISYFPIRYPFSSKRYFTPSMVKVALFAYQPLFTPYHQRCPDLCQP